MHHSASKVLKQTLNKKSSLVYSGFIQNEITQFNNVDNNVHIVCVTKILFE